MTKVQANDKCGALLAQALEDIKAGNFWLARSILKDALSMSNKAGTKKRSGHIMLAVHRVNAAMA